jgi:hypothetical protein
MALNVRLKPLTLRTLDALARQKGLSRSDVVREAIAHYGLAENAAASGHPFEAWADVIGTVALGARDATRTTGEQFAAIVADTRAARPAPRRRGRRSR